MSVVDTHCLPKGTLGTGELPVMQVPSGGNVAIPTGAKRGVVVLLHGISLTVGTPYPLPLVDDAADLMLSFSNDLVNDGWVVVYPGELGDSYLTSQDAGVRADLSADTGNGTRLLANTLHWWDHVVLWIQSNFGNWPIVPFGISWGGWQALQIARNKTSTIIAYGGNVPVSQAWTIDFFGLYDQPPKLSYTLTSGMNNQTLPQATITVNESISSAAASGCLIIVTSSGNQVVNYSGKSGSSFTGCSGGYGAGSMTTAGSVTQSSYTSGLDVPLTGLNSLGIPGYITWETGDTVIGYSNTQTLYTNAVGTGSPVTNFSVSGGGHLFLASEVSAAMNWFTTSAVGTSGGIDSLAPKIH